MPRLRPLSKVVLARKPVARRLPRLILIADQFTQEKVAAKVVDAVAAGIAWVHLRNHSAPLAVFEQKAIRIVEELRAISPNLRMSINTHVAVARKLGLGLHVGRRGPAVVEARQRTGGHVLGYSAHSIEDAKQAVKDGADYLFFSPIFTTTSKPHVAPLGVDALEEVNRAVPQTPVYALGGITPERLSDCLCNGAYGAAVLSGILAAPDVRTAVHVYQAALEAVLPNHNL